MSDRLLDEKTAKDSEALFKKIYPILVSEENTPRVIVNTLTTLAICFVLQFIKLGVPLTKEKFLENLGMQWDELSKEGRWSTDEH